MNRYTRLGWVFFILFFLSAGIAQASIILPYEDGDVMNNVPETFIVESSYDYANPLFGLTISTTYYDEFDDSYQFILYNETNTDGMFSIDDVFIYQYKNYTVNASYYNSMINDTIYQEITLSYLDDSLVNQSLPFVHVKDFNYHTLDYNANGLRSEPLSYSLACNHDDQTFFYAGGTWYPDDVSFVLFNFTEGGWDDPHSYEEFTMSYKQGDTTFNDYDVHIGQYINLYDAVLFCIGMNTSDVFITTDSTCSMNVWSHDDTYLTTGGGLTYNRSGIANYYEIFAGTTVRPGDAIWFHDPDASYRDMVNDYGVAGNIDNLPFILGMIIVAAGVIIPLGFSIRLDIDFPNYFYSLCSIGTGILAFALSFIPGWFLLGYAIVVFMMTSLVYKQTLGAAIDMIPTPFTRGIRSMDSETVTKPLATAGTKAKSYMSSLRKSMSLPERRTRPKKSSVRERIPRRDTRWGGHGGVPQPSSYKQSYVDRMLKKGYRIEGDDWVYQGGGK